MANIGGKNTGQNWRVYQDPVYATDAEPAWVQLSLFEGIDVPGEIPRSGGFPTMGYRGKTTLAEGEVYAPYIPEIFKVQQ